MSTKSDYNDAGVSAGGLVAYNPGNIVLATLILVAAVANLNLSVANVALPSIGPRHLMLRK